VVAGFHTGDKCARAGANVRMATDSTRRLHHATPAWVGAGAIFHIRIRIAHGSVPPLVEPAVANALLASAEFYHSTGRWFSRLFLLMPDHLHALIAFPRDSDMRFVVGRWKAWHTRNTGVLWQDNFFDHRIRNQRELHLKAEYIRQNPVVKGLCRSPGEWPWLMSR
jgi:putative transposase